MFAIAHDVDSTVILRRISRATGWEEVGRVRDQIDHDLEAERLARELAKKNKELFLGKLR